MIPNELKLSRITPLLKKGKLKSEINSYRSISVQPNIYRIFEGILLSKLNPFVFLNNLIPKQQYSYKRGINISNQHIDLQNVIYNNLNDKHIKCVDIIFLDLSSAFDLVPHDMLLLKLNSMGISGIFLKLLLNSFVNRKQFVNFNNFISKVSVKKRGVAQGGKLSPILYNLFVANLPNIVKCDIFMFADDIVIVNGIENIDDINVLQNDLKNIELFCKQNELLLNEQKTEHLRIELKKSDFYNYKLNNCYISSVEYHKHLGVSYDKRMIFNIHCSDIITKSYSKFNLLKHICPKVNGHVFLKLYKSYILPIIEYSNLCFTPTQTQLYKIEKIEKKISKYICFKLNITNLNYSDRLKALNLTSLKKRSVNS